MQWWFFWQNSLMERPEVYHHFSKYRYEMHWILREIRTTITVKNNEKVGSRPDSF